MPAATPDDRRPDLFDLEIALDRDEERRVHPRLPVAAMYSTVEAKPVAGDATGNALAIVDGLPEQSGHVYDVSLTGARIELDADPGPGARLDLALRLPSESAAIHVTGRVVRVYDDADDPGARRLGIAFERFAAVADELRLRRFLGEPGSRLAA